MRRAAIAALMAWAFVLAGQAQVRPIYDTGATGLTQVLQRLQTTASVLHTGAHPDDEDSAFIARVARGDHARVAYFSLNRGEGGQNIIGPELFDALGVIRTEELLQARRLDGAQQFFGHTFDYGFSKSRTEAAMKWGERDTLGDVVRVIRMFRPLVIYSRWSGTPTDGHGHHQEAGYLTPLAYKAAADPSEFPEQLREGLRPWQVKKLYRGVFGGGNARPDPSIPTLQVQTGLLDPVAGRSYAEISFEGRSQHRTQAQGGIEPRGPLASTLAPVDFVGADLKVGPYTEKGVFDGLDITVSGIAKLAGLPDGTIRPELAAMDAAAKKALADYEPLNPARIIPALADGLRATRAARTALKSSSAPMNARADADFLLGFKEDDFSDALVRAAEVDVDPLAARETVVAGDSIDVQVRTFVPASSNVPIGKANLNAPAGWTADPLPNEAPAQVGFINRRETPTNLVSYRVRVSADAQPTQPYYLKQPRNGDVYKWTDTDPKALPFDPPLLTASVTVTIGGVDVVVTRPVQFRYADDVRGELRRDINVVPRLAVGLDTSLLIVPLGTTPNQQRVVIRATSFSPQTVSGALRLHLPQGWTSTPAEAPFNLRASGDQTSTPFVVTAPARRTSGRFDISAEATASNATFSRDVQVIAYPHIQTHRLYWPATATAQVFDLKVAPVKVGYVMGSGDQVADAIRRMGIDVTMLDGDALATGDLSRFDTIVVGIRASETNPNFVANNGRLLDYVQRGGTMIVQYQQQEYANRMLPPYPATPPTNANPRVTVEDAPVKILVPTHPAFNFPNRITDADFNGWVQERNSYAFTTFDSRYVPLLETADPGEPPVRGAEVYAEVGKGRYVYTSYSWFRQLPAGVPGAYRQFANLISLSKAPR